MQVERKLDNKILSGVGGSNLFNPTVNLTKMLYVSDPIFSLELIQKVKWVDTKLDTKWHA